MDLTIDGRKVWAKPGQTLLELVRQLGFLTGKLSADPLAAKIAGEIFTLNYIPVREKNADSERPSIRRAMASSNGEVHLLRYADPTGKDTYVRTAQFVIFLSLRQLWPQAEAKMNQTVGAGLYVSVSGAEDFSAEKLKRQIKSIVEQDIPLLRRRILTKDAICYYSRQGQPER